MQNNDSRWRFKKLTGKELEAGIKYIKINDLMIKNPKIKNEPNTTMILRNLWLGDYITASNNDFIKNKSIKKIINVTFDIPNNVKNVDIVRLGMSEKYPCYDKNIKVDKLLHIGADIVNTELKKGNSILVHCKRGHHRSASIVAFYMMKYLGFSAEDSIRYIKKFRPNAFRRMTCMVDYLISYDVSN